MPVTTSSSAVLAAGLRHLTDDESARLDWLRGQLHASRAEVHSPEGLGALVDTSRAAWERSGAAAAPEAMLAALAVGLGDLLVQAAPGAAWVLRSSDGASGPAIVDASGAAVVLPFQDVRERWADGRTNWVAGYVVAAASHLRGTPGEVPQPRPAPEPADSRPAPTGPADLPFPPSPQTQDLVLRALEIGLEGAAVGGTDLPIVVVPDGSAWHVETALGDLGSARTWVAASGAPRAAVAWLGELDGVPAVYAEAADAGAPGLVVAHRFTPRTTPEPARRHARPRVADPVGDLVLVGQSAPLL